MCFQQSAIIYYRVEYQSCPSAMVKSDKVCEVIGRESRGQWSYRLSRYGINLILQQSQIVNLTSYLKVHVTSISHLDGLQTASITSKIKCGTIHAKILGFLATPPLSAFHATYQ